MLQRSSARLMQWDSARTLEICGYYSRTRALQLGFLYQLIFQKVVLCYFIGLCTLLVDVQNDLTLMMITD